LNTAALAGERRVNKKSHKLTNAQNYLTENFFNLLGYPSSILDGKSETVMILYLVDKKDVIHVQQISTLDAELRKYVLKHLNGKKNEKYTNGRKKSG